MRREPYVPGACAPLEPARYHAEPIATLDLDELAAACRRTDAICARVSLAVAAVGFCWVAISAGCQIL